MKSIKNEYRIIKRRPFGHTEEYIIQKYIFEINFFGFPRIDGFQDLYGYSFSTIEQARRYLEELILNDGIVVE